MFPWQVGEELGREKVAVKTTKEIIAYQGVQTEKASA